MIKEIVIKQSSTPDSPSPTDAFLSAKNDVVKTPKLQRKKMYEDAMRLAAIVESSEDAIISKTLNGIITSWNKAAEKIFGYKDFEIIGKPINVIIPPSLQHEEKNIIAKIRNGEKVEHFETVRLTKSGEQINISLTVSPVKDEAGKIIGASKIARDITEKVRMDKQLKVYIKKLKELNHYKDEFIATASHELKTPLTVIKANIELLQIKLKEYESGDFVSRSIIQINKLSALIDNMLDISKVQSGKLELSYSSFDFKNLLSEVIDTLHDTYPSHKIVDGSCQNNCIINADYLRIEQVIVNMLTNAIKYSPDSAEVFVSAECADSNLKFMVKDAGIGIPKSDIKKVFNRFFRVKESSYKFLGSGIGLYISNEIIKKHKGKMWVESEENQGSSFYFKIPV